MGLHLVILVATLLAISNSFGDDQVCEPITVRESPDLHNQIEGSIEPDKIPSWLKYRMFVIMYDIHVNDLIQKLSPKDHAILNNLSVETEHWQVMENVRYGDEFLDLCAKSSSMDTVALAREYERIAAESNNRAGDRARQAIEALSSSGRQIIEEFIQDIVTPELSFPRTDTADLALKDPESARANLEIMCYTQINGELPPEVQKAMECFRQQMEIERDYDSSNQAISIIPKLENENSFGTIVPNE